MPSAIPARSSLRSTAIPRMVWATARSTFTLAAETPAAETTVADAFDPAVLEAAADPAADTSEPAIRSVDAIIAEVNQTTVIIVTGDAETSIEEPAQTATIAPPAAEPTRRQDHERRIRAAAE